MYAAADDSEREAKTYSYDAIGNIVNKSDVGAADYVYGTGNAAGAGDAGPHAVVSAGGNSYAYDDNGNMVSGAGRTLTWTSFNKPATVFDTATATAFAYGPDRSRILQTRVQGAVTTAVTYVGRLFEQVAETGKATRYVHYIFAGPERVAIYTSDDAPSSSPSVRYLHHDHLGSVDTITDESGAVVERLSYDAFGKRRIATGASAWTDSVLAISGASTPRGFTGHEHLDAFELVHMNGRVYDPALGRFLSADPFVQFPDSTQGLNRYSYVGNNPLSFTDPSGYFFKKLFKKVRRLFKKILRNPIVQAVATVAASFACGPPCAAAASAAFTAVNGGDFGDVLRAAAISFATARAFQAVGHGLGLPDNPAFLSSGHLAKTVAHGAVGGVAAVAGGGKFGHGFLAAGVAQLGAPAIGQIPTTEGRVAAAAIVGGTASKLGGGKFANGAVTAAFGRLYNDEGWGRSRTRMLNSRVRTALSVDDATGEHYYRIRGAICSMGPGCDSGYADSVYDYVNARDVPFSGNDLGGGQKDLLFGMQSIRHSEFPALRTSINATVEGHIFHPGTVTHNVHFENRTLYYDVTGRGTGPYPSFNVSMGLVAFRSGVFRTVSRFGR